MTPGLASVQSTYKQAVQAGGEQAYLAQANMHLGAAAIAYMTYKAASGELNGVGPSDPELRKQWLQAGNMPYSIALGGWRVSLLNLEPLGPMADVPASIVDAMRPVMEKIQQQHAMREQLGLNKHLYGDHHPVLKAMRQTADWVDATRGTDSEDGLHVLTALIASSADALLRPTVAKSMAGAMDAFVNATPQSVEHWLGDIMAGLTPGSKLLETVNGDNTQRESRGLVQGPMKHVPGWSERPGTLPQLPGREAYRAARLP